MDYLITRILPDFCKGRDDLIGFACQSMQQQIANKVLDEIIKGEQIISLDSTPVEEDNKADCSIKLTMRCRIEKLVRCKDCKYNGCCMFQDFVKDNSIIKRNLDDFFCADGKEKD